MRLGERIPRILAVAGLGLLIALPALSQGSISLAGALPAPRSSRVQAVRLPQMQANTVRFERLTVEDGLSQNAVLVILQDQQGFLWLGTEDGLNRYNGYDFVVYKHNPDDPTTLADNVVSTIYLDQAGELWIGTRSGLDRFDRESGAFIHYQHEPTDPQSLGGPWVAAIFEDSTGTLWVGTASAGLDQLDRTTSTFTHYVHDPGDPATLADNSIRAIYEDSRGELWIGTGGGLDRFNRADGTFTHFQHDPGDPQSLSDNAVSVIFEDQEGTLWIGTEGGGLNHLVRSSQTFVRYRHDEDDPNSLSHDRVRSILEDRVGRLWVGTQNGLDLLDRERDLFVHFRHDPYDLHSLGSNSVWSIYEDRTGVLWFGTYGGGLNKTTRMTDQFALYQHSPSRPDSLSDDMVWSIYEDSGGDLWVGTFNGGLNRLDRESGTFTVYQHDARNPASLSSNDVRAVFEDHRGTLWVGTAGGLDKFNRRTETFVHYRHDPQDPDSLSEDRVTTLLEDRNGGLWIGTRTAGLNRLDLASGAIVRYQHNPDDPFSLSDDRVWALYEDRAGAIWVGTLGGISVWDPSSERFTHYVHDPDDSESLSNDAVFSFHEDAAGTLWVGTWGGGLDRFDRATQTFAHFTEQDGLPNNVIYGIEADTEGFLWLSTNRGLSRFDPRSESFRNYDVSDGLQDNEFNVGAHFAGSSGELFFGGIRGFNAFIPDQIEDNPYPPAIVITAFAKFNQVVSTDLAPDERIELDYDDNFISFEFAALDFTAPERNQYAYMMEGLDPDWVSAGTRRHADYPNLSPGNYVFRVRGSNNDGVWNEEGIAYTITILPPFWETWWFRGAIFLVVAGGVIAAYRLRIRAIEARSRGLRDQVKARTIEIERRKQELEALNAIAAVVSHSLDLDQVLNNALEKTLHLTGLEAGGIYLLQRDSDVLRIRTHRGLPPELVSAIDGPQAGEGLPGRVMQTGEPLVVDDLTTDPRGVRLAVRESGFHSAALFPLSSRGRVSGCLFVATCDRCEFSQQDVKLLTAIGHQIGVAVENARLFEDAEQRMHELAALYDADEKLYRHLELEEVLDELVNIATDILKAEKSSVMVWDERRERLVARVARGFSPETVAQMSFAPAEGTVGLVATTGKPAVVEDTHLDARVAKRITEPEGIRSFMHVPIEVAGQVFGVFNADYLEPRAFGDNEKRLFAALAQRAGLAIENASLYRTEQERLEESERRRQVAEGLRDIVAVLNSNRPVHEVLNYIAAQACQLMHSSASLIHHVEHDQGQVTIEAGCGIPGLRGQGKRATKIYNGYADRAIFNRQPYAIPDLRAYVAALDGPEAAELDAGEREWRQSVAQVQARHDLHAFLAVPLIVSDEVYGSLVFYYSEPQQFTEEDITLGTALGDQAALAIENARLRARVEEAAVSAERTRLARDLHDAVTQTLFSTSLIADVLPRLWERNPDEGRRRLEEVRQLTRGALAEMRTLLLELRPSALVDAELGDLLRQLADATTGRARVQVTVNTEGRCSLAANVKVALYRIAQEALNNVAKHAGASYVTIDLRCQPEEVELRISDDGRGFELTLPPANRLGLGIMRERAEDIGAALNIDSEPGRGTEVSVAWAADPQVEEEHP
jgi:ligand-binding sensor domain-containing protein/GAF domain-containing protein